MKLLQTIVSATDFRGKGHAWRDEMFPGLLRVAQEQRVDAILLPGGYWMADDLNALRPLLQRLKRALPDGISLLAGIDLPQSRKKLTAKGSSGFSKHPYYGFAILPDEEPRIWQQTSVTSTDAWDVPEESIPGSGRIVTIAGQSVGVLICGELFSERTRLALIELRPELIVDLGHASMGTGVTRAMEKLARLGGSVVAHTHHVVWGTSSLHFVNRGGKRQSVIVNDCEYLGDNDRWISWIVREI